jgi:hypothetical protein
MHVWKYHSETALYNKERMRARERERRNLKVFAVVMSIEAKAFVLNGNMEHVLDHSTQAVKDIAVISSNSERCFFCRSHLYWLLGAPLLLTSKLLDIENN